MRNRADDAVKEGALIDVCILCGEEAARDAIAYWFQSSQTQAAVADDGYQANRILRSESCRLLVTDRVLPPWPGLDTFMTLRGRNPRLRIAFVDNGSRDDWSLARVTGATDFLPRPLTRETVMKALSQRVTAA